MLKKFAMRAQEKHSIAFFQWRGLHRGHLTCCEELREVISDRIDNVLSSIDITSKVSKQTAKEGALSFQTEKDIGVSKVKVVPWLINSFWNIGWPDPFPDEHSSIDQEFLKNKEDLVYAPSRYVAEHSPIVIYLPNKSVMVKIMRACLGVNDLDELWIR